MQRTRLALVLACLPASFADAQSIRLNDLLAPEATSSSVDEFVTNAVSGVVAHTSIEEDLVLYLGPADGSSNAISVSRSFLFFRTQFSPDGDWLLYRGVASPDYFSIPSLGGTPNNLSLDEGFVRQIEVTPDSASVIFIADREVFEPRELYLTSIDGSSPSRRLSEAMEPSADVTSFVIAPDGSAVVYTVTDASGLRLFSVGTSGSSAPVLLASGPEGTQAARIEVSPDSSTVVVELSGVDAVPSGIFSVALQGGAAPIRVSGSLPTFAEIELVGIAADSQEILYLADATFDETIEF